MNDEHKNFSVWLFRERHWAEGSSGRRVGSSYGEPAEAADWAEHYLKVQGVPGQSYCELRFNGEKEPHTVICYMGKNEFGIWNTDHAQWPIFYAEEGGSHMLADFPFEIKDDGNQWQERDESDSKQKSEDEGSMNLDEIEENDDEEVEDDGDERTEDEEVSEDDEASEESAADDFEAEDDDEDREDESSEEDEEGTDLEDDEGSEQEDAEEDFSDEEEGDLDALEKEVEVPRLRIFAKFRGPLGWRKRAEAEELQEKNTFILKLGVLDPDAEKTSEQEREVFAQIQFIESDNQRDLGLLRLKLPDGVEFSQPTKNGWIAAAIPYRQKENL